MAGNFEIVEGKNGVASTAVKVQANVELVKRDAITLANVAARGGAQRMRQMAPSSGKSEGFGTKLRERVSASEANYTPGGSGGGGTWTAHFGITPSALYPDPEKDPATWVFEGTGIFGPRNQRIFARSGNFLAWISGGRTHFAHSVKGMEPRTAWVTFPRQRAEEIVARGLARLGLSDI